jgi:hypothetical protein
MKALLSEDADERTANYLSAWAAGGAPPELAVEVTTHLMRAKRSSELKAFVDSLPAKVRDNERIVLARAEVAANDGRFDELERLLMDRQFATIREGETVLSDLWIRLRRGRLEAALGRGPTAHEVKDDLLRHPVPRELDLRMHALDES